MKDSPAHTSSYYYHDSIFLGELFLLIDQNKPPDTIIFGDVLVESGLTGDTGHAAQRHKHLSPAAQEV